MDHQKMEEARRLEATGDRLDSQGCQDQARQYWKLAAKLEQEAMEASE
jgi:hypothetical protein